MKTTVAIVEDDTRVLASIANLLEAAGYAAVSFTSAEAFLDSEELDAAACLVADVRLPAADGLELHRRIRLERPSLPVIFISGNSDDDVRRRAFRGGAADFFSKPFEGAALLTAIDRAVRGQAL